MGRFAPELGDDRIANYRVERELGPTATGVLYQAVHLVLPRRAVIKVMHASKTPAMPTRHAVALLREACLLEALQHPGVPQIYESGMLDDKRPWFAFEMIEGITLSQRLMAGLLPAIEVARLVRDLAAILEHAHKRGVIHRALRPDHVVLSERRFGVAIPDWTDARAHDAIGVDHAPVASRGARPYLAPEIARGDAADDRADVFALGVIAYQALTGVLPRGDTTRERCPDAPLELASLIDSMLAADRFDRPSTTEVRSDLDWIVDAIAIDLHVGDDVAPSSSATMRIRKPRWTPPITPSTQLLDCDPPVSGEIKIKPKR